jgi:hypothetical protein
MFNKAVLKQAELADTHRVTLVKGLHWQTHFNLKPLLYELYEHYPKIKGVYSTRLLVESNLYGSIVNNMQSVFPIA